MRNLCFYRLQRRDALVDLDARGLPGALPPLAAPAAGRVDAAEVDAVRARLVRRRLGALLRAAGGGGGVRQAQERQVQLGQLAESLIRLARVVVGIRLHVEDLSVEQGVRFFRDEAYLEETSARREAERGTFDPTYVVYSLGKLMLLKLRADDKAKEGAGFSLQVVPRHAARQRHGARSGCTGS